VYVARKARLLSRMPAQPRRAVKRPAEHARVERTSSGRLPVRMMDAWAGMLNQIRRVYIRPTRDQIVNCRWVG